MYVTALRVIYRPCLTMTWNWLWWMPKADILCPDTERQGDFIPVRTDVSCLRKTYTADKEGTWNSRFPDKEKTICIMPALWAIRLCRLQTYWNSSKTLPFGESRTGGVESVYRPFHLSSGTNGFMFRALRTGSNRMILRCWPIKNIRWLCMMSITIKVGEVKVTTNSFGSFSESVHAAFSLPDRLLQVAGRLCFRWLQG